MHGSSNVPQEWLAIIVEHGGSIRASCSRRRPRPPVKYARRASRLSAARVGRRRSSPFRWKNGGALSQGGVERAAALTVRSDLCAKCGARCRPGYRWPTCVPQTAHGFSVGRPEIDAFFSSIIGLSPRKYAGHDDVWRAALGTGAISVVSSCGSSRNSCAIRYFLL